MIDNAICSGAGGRAPKVPVTFQVRKDMAIQVPQRSPKTFYLNRFLPRNKVKFSKIKDKDKILKAAREVQKSHHIQRNPTKLSEDFSAETWKARRDGIIYSTQRKNANQKYLTYQSGPSESKERCFATLAKARGIYHHNSPLRRNAN